MAERSDSAPPASMMAGARGTSSTRALLLTFFGLFVAPGGGPVPTRSVIRALSSVDVDAVTVRRTLNRVLATQLLTRVRTGRESWWDLSDLGRDLVARRDARIFAAEDPGWDGSWLVLAVNVAERQPDVRYRLRTRLAWAGFGQLRSGLWLSPHPHREAEALAVLAELDLAGSADSFVARVGSTTSDRELAEGAWDLAALDAEYRAFLTAWAPQGPWAPTDDDPESAFAGELAMVTHWIGFVAADVGLPASLLPDTWSGHLARRVFLRRHTGWHPAAMDWFTGLAAR